MSSTQNVRATRATRYVLLAASLAILLVAASTTGRLEFADWWPWAAIATCVSIALTEPRFTNPVAAIVNTLAGIAAVASSGRSAPLELWWAYVFFAAIVGLVSGLALVLARTSLGPRLRRLASTFGSARILGFGVLGIEAVTWPAPGGMIWLLGAVAMASVLTSPVLTDTIAANATRSGSKSARFRLMSAEAPNTLTVLSDENFARGDRVELRLQSIAYPATVVAGHASIDGPVLVISTDSDLGLDHLQGSRDIAYQKLVNDDALAMAVSGSTVNELVLRTTKSLAPGTLLARDVPPEGRVLYQVSRSELVRIVDDGHYTTESRTWASQIGVAQTDGSLKPTTSLARAFEVLRDPGSVTATLPSQFVRVGNVVGTSFPVGFDIDDPLTGHVAILGMSGTGKSTLVRRLVEGLAGKNLVGVVDVGGEYTKDLGLGEVSLASYLAKTSPGKAVVNLPTTPVVQGFRSLADNVFEKAKAEFLGSGSQHRVVVAEEAHSLVPEWNFAIGKNDSQDVAAACATVLQSRKYGLRFIFVSQRTANVSKSAISQCANYVVFRMVDETGLDYLSSVAGPSYVDVVRALSPYQALVVGPAFSSEAPVVIDTLPWKT